MRLALLGSPGIGVPYRPPFKINASAASILNDPAATYAAVVAGHKLLIARPQDATPIQVVFAGTENTRALFLATLSAALTGLFAVATSGGNQLTITTQQLGAIIEGTKIAAAGSDADVLASLGLVAGTVFTGPANPSELAYGARTGSRYFGKPTAGAATAYQHATVVRVGPYGAPIIVDRGVRGSVSSDLVRFAPTPGA